MCNVLSVVICTPECLDLKTSDDTTVQHTWNMCTVVPNVARHSHVRTLWKYTFPNACYLRTIKYRCQHEQICTLFPSEILAVISLHVESPHQAVCSTCGKVYTGLGSLANLHRHYKSFHLKEAYPCPWCYKRFTRHDSLKRHLKSCKHTNLQ